MEKVKIKRVKRNKKKTTTGEKVLAAVGLGSTLLGGAGAVSSQPKTTQFVRTQTTEKGSKTQGIKDRLREIFGIKQAKASSPVDDAYAALTAAQNALSDFDGWVTSATNDIPKFAPEDQAQRQSEIDAEVARTRPGLVAAVSDAQRAYDDAVKAAQGPQEGDTKTEGGLTYTFYQGGWVLNNGQTKTEGGFSYGSEGGQWILLDGQTKTENGKTYVSSGGQWVEKPADVQAPQIGDTKTGDDGYQYVFSNSVYASGAWTLVDGQTKAVDGKVYKSQGGSWVEQNLGPKEGDTKTENGRSYHFTGGEWVDNAGNRVQNPNGFYYIADGNGGWTLEDGQTKTENGKTYISSGGEWVQQSETGAKEGDTKTEGGLTYTFYQGGWVLNNGQTKTEGGFSYGSEGGQWILLDGQTKTVDGVVYISSGGSWVVKPAGVAAPKVGDTKTGDDGYQYVFSNSVYASGAWTLVDGQTKTEGGVTYVVKDGTWVAKQEAGAKEGDTRANAQGEIEAFHNGQWGKPFINDYFTDDSGLRYYNIGSMSGEAVWVPVAGQEKVGDDGKTYVADGHGSWTLKTAQPGVQSPAVTPGTPTVTFVTNSGNTTTPKVGDTWTITITGPVGAPVYATANGSTTQMGVIGADGKLVLTGTFQAGDVGTWNEKWTVGDGAAQVAAGNVDFKLTAQSNNEVQQTVPFGLDSLSFTIKDNGDGSFSIIYDGKVLVTGKTQADIEAARAKYPSLYATPEAVVLSTVSRNFNNYFLTTGSQVKLDNGTRTTVSTTISRDVFRDGSGNAAAYFTEFGGRIYFDKATGDLYQENKDGNYVKMDLSQISPETRQNIINVLTGSGSNIKVTTVTHNLLSELGQPAKGPNLKQDPKDGNWYVIDEKGNYVLDAKGNRIQAPLQRYVWSPGGWSSWGYNVEGLNEEMAKYASKQYTVDVVTAPNGAKTYTLSTKLPDGTAVSRTFMNSTEFNNFLSQNFTTADAFIAMSPQDKAIFMAATDARIHFPELTTAFIGNTPAASTNHRIIWQNPNNGMIEVQGLINPIYMSTYQQAQTLQTLFPGSTIKERPPLSWPGVMAYEYDPADPRRVYELILSDGTVMNVSFTMNSMRQDGQTLTVQGFPQNVIDQLKAPTGTKVNALFVGGVGYGSAADNANAAAGLLEPGSFGPSANPTYTGAIIPMTWHNLGNGQGGFVDPASPYTINQQNGLNPNQGVVPTGVKPTTVTTTTNTLLSNLFTLPVNVGTGSPGTGSAGAGTGANTGTGAQQTAPMPSITKVSSQKLKPGDTIQITGQNIVPGSTLVELLNQQNKVVGLTVVNSTATSITVKLPESGLSSGQYTLQLRFVGVGANFGKASAGVPVTVESGTTGGLTGNQAGSQTQAGTQAAVGQAAQSSASISVGEDLGKNPANNKAIFLTHLAVYTQNNVNTSGKVAPGSTIELGGQGLSAYNKYSLVIDGQEYEIKKFTAGDNVIKLTVPSNLPASIPAGSALQVKLYSAYQGVKQGVITQNLLYSGGGTGSAGGAAAAAVTGAGSAYDQYIQNLQSSFNQDSGSVGQDAQDQTVEYDNSDNALATDEAVGQDSTDAEVENAEQADNQDTETEVEATTDTETETTAESADGAEVEATEDTDVADSASQNYWNNLNNGTRNQPSTVTGNTAGQANLLRANALGSSGSQNSLSADEVEAGTEEETDGGNAGSVSYWNNLNTSGGGNVVSPGGATQIRGGTGGIRGTVSTLGAADQAWTGGLRMPAGYPASNGLQMPDTTASDNQESTDAEAATYKVKKGDTLWSIAKKHYGDGKKWRKILEANLDKVKDPKKLKIGTELVIPKI